MKKILLISVILTFYGGLAFGQDWDSSPFNYKNSPYNYDNSPYNYKNSPYNYDNSPYKYGNDRIIRDNYGKDTGLYAVPKDDGGTNIFDRNGNRRGYIPGN